MRVCFVIIGAPIDCFAGKQCHGNNENTIPPIEYNRADREMNRPSNRSGRVCSREGAIRRLWDEKGVQRLKEATADSLRAFCHERAISACEALGQLGYNEAMGSAQANNHGGYDG